MTEKDKLIEGHNYDGIQELNNPLPGWWLMTFYLTIIFSVIYFGYYQIFGGPTSEEELASALSSIQGEREIAAEERGEKTEQDFVAMAEDSAAIESGMTEYVAKCAVCHGDKGQGLIGPNLTDEYWISADGSVTSIITTINTGVVDKGMPPWKGQIAPELIENIAVYVYTLQGTEPEGAKPPQGEKITK